MTAVRGLLSTTCATQLPIVSADPSPSCSPRTAGRRRCSGSGRSRSTTPQRSRRSGMDVGPWLVVDGRPAAGSLGVLMDDVLGQAVIVGRPGGHWAVTTELAVDVCAPLPS